MKGWFKEEHHLSLGLEEGEREREREKYMEVMEKGARELKTHNLPLFCFLSNAIKNPSVSVTQFLKADR